MTRFADALARSGDYRDRPATTSARPDVSAPRRGPFRVAFKVDASARATSLPPLAAHYAEAAGRVRTRARAGSVRIAFVVSADASEGRTDVVIGLARGLSRQFGETVLVVDGAVDDSGAVHGTGAAAVTVYPLDAGIWAVPAPAVARCGMDAVVAAAVERYDWVLVDAPPLVDVSGRSTPGMPGSGIVMVVADRSGVAERVDACIARAGGAARVLGAVVTHAGSASAEQSSKTRRWRY